MMMSDNLRVVRYYKNRFVSTTEGAVNQKEYTGRMEIQRLTLVNSVVDGKVEINQEWRPLPVVDVEG
jgi:predicted ATP-dependent serine protease